MAMNHRPRQHSSEDEALTPDTPDADRPPQREYQVPRPPRRVNTSSPATPNRPAPTIAPVLSPPTRCVVAVHCRWTTAPARPLDKTWRLRTKTCASKQRWSSAASTPAISMTSRPPAVACAPASMPVRAIGTNSARMVTRRRHRSKQRRVDSAEASAAPTPASALPPRARAGRRRPALSQTPGIRPPGRGAGHPVVRRRSGRLPGGSSLAA